MSDIGSKVTATTGDVKMPPRVPEECDVELFQVVSG